MVQEEYKGYSTCTSYMLQIMVTSRNISCPLLVGMPSPSATTCIAIWNRQVPNY